MIVIIWRIISYGETGPFPVVVFNVICNNLSNKVTVVAIVVVIQFEIQKQLFFDPPIQRFIDRIVRRLSSPGHGSNDVLLGGKLVERQGSIYGTLVGMQIGWISSVCFKQIEDLLQAVEIRLSGTSAVREFPAEYLLGEYIKVQSEFIQFPLYLECSHIRNDDLARSVNRLPGRQNQIWETVNGLTLAIAPFVASLRFDSKLAEYLVNKAVAELIRGIDPNICCDPTISMGGMRVVDISNQRNRQYTFVHSRAGYIRVASFKVLVVTSTAYIHQLA